MKVRYIGESFGVDGLTDNRTYDVVEVDQLTQMLRIIDDSGEDYLYSPKAPKPLAANRPYGRFEIIEDDEQNTLLQLIGN